MRFDACHTSLLQQHDRETGISKWVMQSNGIKVSWNARNTVEVRERERERERERDKDRERDRKARGGLSCVSFTCSIADHREGSSERVGGLACCNAERQAPQRTRRVL